MLVDTRDSILRIDGNLKINNLMKRDVGCFYCIYIEYRQILPVGGDTISSQHFVFVNVFFQKIRADTKNDFILSKHLM